MSERAKSLSLGLFVLLALGLLAWLVLFLKPSVGNGDLQLRVRFSNIDRITPGARVTFAGKAVGEVEEIREIPHLRQAQSPHSDELYVYELVLRVDSSVQIYNYDKIGFNTAGLLGEKSIEITPKGAPTGASAAHEITHEVLYASSRDQLQETLEEFKRLAACVEETLCEVSCFLKTTGPEFQVTLSTMRASFEQLCGCLHDVNETDLIERLATAADRLALAMGKTHDFFAQAEEHQIIERTAETLGHFQQVAQKINSDQGTLGHLLNSDCLYVQITTLLCQVQVILEDIQNYGLLYQFDRKWQRLREQKH